MAKQGDIPGVKTTVKIRRKDGTIEIHKTSVGSRKVTKEITSPPTTETTRIEVQPTIPLPQTNTIEAAVAKGSGGIIERLPLPKQSIAPPKPINQELKRYEDAKATNFTYTTKNILGQERKVSYTPQEIQRLKYSAEQSTRTPEQRRTDEVLMAGGVAALGTVPLIVGAAPLAIGAGLAAAGSQLTTVGQYIGNPLAEKPTSDLRTQKDIAKTSFEASEQEANKDFGSGIVYNYVPGGQVFAADSFIKSAQDRLINEYGYSKEKALKEAKAIYNQFNVGGAIGEVAGMVTLSGGTEILGRTFTKSALKGTVVNKGISFWSKEGQKLATKSGIAIAKAGAVEGLGFYGLETQAKMKKYNVIDASIYTAGGALSAGVIGGALVAGSFTNPKLTKWTQRALFAIDPTEKPGDIIGDAASFYLKKNFSPKVKVVTIVPTTTNTMVRTPPISVITPTNIFTNIKSSTQTQTKSQSKADTYNWNFTNTNTKTQTSTQTSTQTNTKTNNIISTQNNIFSQTNTPTQTQTQTQTNTSTQTQTNTPVNIFSKFPAYPPVGFALGGADGGRGSKFGVKNIVRLKSIFGNPKNYAKPTNPRAILIKRPGRPPQAQARRSFFNFSKPTQTTQRKTFFNMTKPSKLNYNPNLLTTKRRAGMF